MKKISINILDAVNKYGLDRAFEICKKSGFDAIDYDVGRYPVNSGVYVGSDDEFEEHFHKIAKTAEKYELIIGQTHGRCETYEPGDVSRREIIDKVCQKDLKATAILGAPSCVVHFISTSSWGKQPPEVMRSVSQEMYNNIIPFAEEYKVNIALETFGASLVRGDRIREFFADPDEFKMQFNAMDTKYKTMCVDTGHIHEAESFWVPPPEEYIKILGKDVTLLHLHDNFGRWDDHQLPGHGSVRWTNVFDALDEIDYKGTYNLELALLRYGNSMEDFLYFAGKFMRRFVDNHGQI